MLSNCVADRASVRAVPVIVSPDGCCEASGREVALCESDALIDPCLFTLPADRSAAGLDLSPSQPSTRAVFGAHPPRSEYAVSAGKGCEGCMAFALGVGCRRPFPAFEGADTSAVNRNFAS